MQENGEPIIPVEDDDLWWRRVFTTHPHVHRDIFVQMRTI